MVFVSDLFRIDSGRSVNLSERSLITKNSILWNCSAYAEKTYNWTHKFLLKSLRYLNPLKFQT